MDAKEFEALLNDAESRLERLRALYDQWFQGIERLEPLVVRKDFERRVHVLRKEQPRNTALRFRFNSMWQRYVTFQTHWSRIARRIEEGTYRRDIEKVRKKRLRERARRSQAPKAIDVEAAGFENLDLEKEVAAAVEALEQKAPVQPQETGAAAQATFAKPQDPFAAAKPSPNRPPQPPRNRPAAPPPPPRASSMDDRRMRSLYDEFVAARRQNNERTDNVRYEAMVKSVNKMLPKLQEKHRGKDIDFKVVVKDGKVGLKPVTKK